MKTHTRRRKRSGTRKRRTRTSLANSPISYVPLFRTESYYPDEMSAVYSFQEMTYGLDYEICATLKLNPDNIWFLKLHNTKNIAEGKRHSCSFKYYESIILHNHPDKYFPSVEDIEKVVKMKNQEIIKSYIVSRVGIWIFIVSPENKINESKIADKRDDLNQIISEFYNNKYTERGRKYDAAAINRFCKKMNSLYGFELSFIPT